MCFHHTFFSGGTDLSAFPQQRKFPFLKLLKKLLCDFCALVHITWSQYVQSSQKNLIYLLFFHFQIYYSIWGKDSQNQLSRFICIEGKGKYTNIHTLVNNFIFTSELFFVYQNHWNFLITVQTSTLQEMALHFYSKLSPF